MIICVMVEKTVVVVYKVHWLPLGKQRGAFLVHMHKKNHNMTGYAMRKR